MALIKYGWWQLSKWELSSTDFYVKHLYVETALSGKVLCSWRLVKITDSEDGITKLSPVKKCDVTQEILDEAGEP